MGGALVTVIPERFLYVLFPQLFTALTDTVPPVAPGVAVILSVVLVPDQPLGNSHW